MEVTGFVLIGMKIGDVPSKSHYNDAAYWNLPDELTQNIESLHNPYDNPSFEIPKNEGVIEE